MTEEELTTLADRMYDPEPDYTGLMICRQCYACIPAMHMIEHSDYHHPYMEWRHGRLPVYARPA